MAENKRRAKRAVQDAIMYKINNGIPLTNELDSLSAVVEYGKKKSQVELEQMKQLASQRDSSDQVDQSDQVGSEDPLDDDDDAFTDKGFASQMLKDLRKAYKSTKGSKKLKTMMADDKNFAFFVKELLRIETQAATSKNGKNGEGNGNRPAVLVIIRGLEDEYRVDAALNLYKESPATKRQVDKLLDPAGKGSEADDEQGDEVTMEHAENDAGEDNPFRLGVENDIEEASDLFKGSNLDISPDNQDKEDNAGSNAQPNRSVDNSREIEEAGVLEGAGGGKIIPKDNTTRDLAQDW